METTGGERKGGERSDARSALLMEDGSTWAPGQVALDISRRSEAG